MIISSFWRRRLASGKLRKPMTRRWWDGSGCSTSDSFLLPCGEQGLSLPLDVINAIILWNGFFQGSDSRGASMGLPEGSLRFSVVLGYPLCWGSAYEIDKRGHDQLYPLLSYWTSCHIRIPLSLQAELMCWHEQLCRFCQIAVCDSDFLVEFWNLEWLTETPFLP